MDLSELRRVCIDETAARRGHDYISLFVGIDQRRVAFVTDGRDAKTIECFADHVDAHNSDASRIQHVCIDMSAPFHQGRHREPHRGRDHLRQVPRHEDARRRRRQDPTRRSQDATGAEGQSLPLAQEQQQPLEQRQGSTRLIVEAALEDCARLSLALLSRRSMRSSRAGGPS